MHTAHDLVEEQQLQALERRERYYLQFASQHSPEAAAETINDILPPPNPLDPPPEPDDPDAPDAVQLFLATDLLFGDIGIPDALLLGGSDG